MRRPLHAAKDAQAFGKLRADQSAQKKRQRRLARTLIVDEDVIDRDRLPELDHFRLEAVELQTPSLRSLPKRERPAVLQIDDGVGLYVGVGGVTEDAVVEDFAVLVDFDERRVRVCAAARSSTSLMWLTSTSRVRATKVASAASASDNGRNGVSNDPSGLDLVMVPARAVGEYCPLRAPSLRC